MHVWPSHKKMDDFNATLRESKHGMSYKAWKGERKEELAHLSVVATAASKQS